ncbi:hypothetical protein HY383_02205 [Candidatus Daviesbacteria bacterium]|nr:hypothetical protein [Candidatus Daviesbacteria bacterium]
MPKSNPNDFNKTTVDILAKRAGQVCSKCKRHTSGGNSTPTKATIVGDAAHIEGVQPTSARYNSKMTPEERSDIKNGIWLCKTCHKEIDDDPIKYTVETLKKMKKDHEGSILNLEPLNPSLGSINLGHNKVEIKEGDSYIINNIYMATPSPQIPDTIVTGGEEIEAEKSGNVPFDDKVSITLSPFMGIVKSPELPGTRIQLEFAVTNNHGQPTVIKGSYVRLNDGIVHFKKFFKINPNSSREPDYTTRFPIILNTADSTRLTIEFENFELSLVEKGELVGELFVLIGNEKIASKKFIYEVNDAMVNTLEYFQSLALSKSSPFVFDAMIKS